MSDVILWLRTALAAHWQQLRETKHDDRGGVVETVIIAAAMATLALAVMAAIKLLVDEKVGDISL